MQLGIMQPYFFPYIGYWQLFFNCDEWVFFDDVQYNKRSWMNRNRVLHSDPSNEFQYINVPIKKHERGTLIKDVMINTKEQWVKKLTGQLTVYKRLRAPYYSDVVELIEGTLCKKDVLFTSLITRTADMLCEYLDIKVKHRHSSELDIDARVIHEPDDWALAISELLKADEYINPYGGAEIFDVDKYQVKGIEIKFLKPELNEYKQSQRAFVSGLSIIDVLMFNSKSEVCRMLQNDFQLLSKSEALS